MIGGYARLRIGAVRRDAANAFGPGLEGAAASLATTIDAWTDTHEAQAVLLAQVAAHLLPKTRDRTANGVPGSHQRAELGTLLDSLVAAGQFAEAVITTDSGEIVAASHDAGKVSTDDPGRRTRIVAGTDGLTLEARARAQPQHLIVTVRSRVRREDFRQLANPPRRSDVTPRTYVVMPFGDSLIVALTDAPRNADGPPTVFDRRRAPATLRASLDLPRRHGEAMGVTGTAMFYGTNRVDRLGLGIVREVGVGDFLAQARVGAVVEGIMLAMLIWGLMFGVHYRRRTVRLRREEELTTLRANFVASASHELRTPLTQITMFAELLRTGALPQPSDTARALNVIEKEARRLSILVDNVLNFARLRQQPAHATNTHFTNVAEDVYSVVEAFEPLAAERRINLRTEVADLPLASVDSLALRQVLLNYLENATKYGPEGQTLTISASWQNGRVRINVDDEGPGVAASERDLIWEAFHRGAAGIATHTTGSGIGLAVVRELVTRHGGIVGVEDAPEGGARFYVEFDAASEPHMAARW
ncbi:MAG: HAMP domain-containing sensor histidine kinase [Gemmatimonadaceae bacterium]